ncbi:hypothetical protein GW571_03330 [Clavibacter capsici]|uniref:hypothetical protein n=1 Tax=Clavibacter capsici TaxID=1874630 RepID=UPI0014287A5A|nr:hypothetical protein [Clavibacter capsici]QIS41244.1 hypothetical protein GW571_03330 [Clavibacter capsici]
MNGQEDRLKVLFVGRGVMTQGIIRNVAPVADVRVLSRHYPDPGNGGKAGVDDISAALEWEPSVIVSCAESEARASEIWFGDQMRGYLEDRPAHAVEMGTLGVRWFLDWHRAVGATRGRAVESPLTGSRSGAARGSLSAFRHSADDTSCLEPFYSAMAAVVYDFPTPGDPTRFKLLYNAWGAALLQTLTTFVPLFESALPESRDTAWRILRYDGWMSLVMDAKLDRALGHDFGDADFSVRNMVKDLGHALEMIGDGQGRAEIVRVKHAYDRAAREFGPGTDFSAVTRVRPPPPHPPTDGGSSPPAS